MLKPVEAVACALLAFPTTVTTTAFAQQVLPPGAEPRMQYPALVAQGTVARHLLNPRGEVDGLLLTDGTQIKFPPHMSTELTATVSSGDPVAVQGFRELSGAVRAFVITDLRTNSSVAEHEPMAPPLPPHLRNVGLTALSVQGRIQYLTRGPRGELDGVMLDNGTILRFPPDVGYRLASLLRVGQSITAQGYGTENEYGRALEVTAIGDAGQPPQPLYGSGLLDENAAGPLRR
jgi:hypothetical protein